MGMSHRERVITTLKREEPDRVPFDLGGSSNSTIHADAYRRLKVHFGVEGEDTTLAKDFGSVIPDEAVLQALDIDFRGVYPGGPDKKPDAPVDENETLDEWGILRRMPPGSSYYDVVNFPLAGPISLQDIVNYPWPDPKDPGYTRGLRDRITHLRDTTDCAIALRVPSPMVHATQFLRGFEDWFADLVGDQKMANALFQAVQEITSATAAHILKETGDLIDIVAFGDDLGFQTGPMVSPDLYRKMIKPWHKKHFNVIKDHTKAFIHYHSCGSIAPLLDDFIELGVDAINPVQVAADNMDTKMLKERFGDRVTFWGGVDTQQVLPEGTPDEVRAETKKRIEDLAPGGGYILAAVHNIQPGVPAENILAMYEAGREYGHYPIGDGQS